jgi:SGNH hydrolase-like domain, acetyltransferase AlgX
MALSALPPAAVAEGAAKAQQHVRWVVFPLLSLLTILAMLSLAEILSRQVWSEGGTDFCKVFDPNSGERNKPNCTARLKAPEGQWVQYSYNECGYRTLQPCGARPASAIRVVAMGASTTEGNMVPYEQTFSTVGARDLSQFYNRPVEFQNMGTTGCLALCAYRRLDEALRLKPDLVLLALAPFDVQVGVDPASLAARDDPFKTLAPPRKAAASSFIERLAGSFTGSRAVLAARHFLYQDSGLYLKLYLMQRDKAGFLRQPFPLAWEKRFSDIDLLLGEMADKCRAAGVPFALMAVPERAQAAALQQGDLPEGAAPYAFRDRLALIAKRHEILFLDVFPDFARLPHPETLFYPADGHLTPPGQSVVGHALARDIENSRLVGLSLPEPPKPRS